MNSKNSLSALGSIRNWMLLAIVSIINFNAFAQSEQEVSLQHPKWSLQSNIYEVNLRQYTKEGTIAAFKRQLPRLRDMGVEILWFMPLHPIGEKGRKMKAGDLGSYYAVKDYTALNPEFGNINEFREMVNTAHQMGFKIIIDWVANHSAIDNNWVESHPEYYTKDSAGRFISPHDWTDVYELDYNNKALWDEMTNAMLFWILTADIDGFRCDVAEEVDPEFWKYALSKLRQQKDIFLLAEGENAICYSVGFDATYGWRVMQHMQDLYKGKLTVEKFRKLMNDYSSEIPANGMRMYFTSNHDENSWNGTEFDKYGAAYKTFAVFTQTTGQSIPLIYSGQESANKKQLKFFVKDSINWKNYELSGFYRDLLNVRREIAALATNAAFRNIETSKDNAIYAYERTGENQKIIVLLNLSPVDQTFLVKDKSFKGSPVEIFKKIEETTSNTKPVTLKAWGFKVYRY